MKKFKFLVAFAVGASVVLSACKKEDPETTNK
jgi:hypothetical protein